MSILKTIYLQHLNGANANMTLTSNERVGIGTSSPSAKLHVSTGTTGGIALLQGSNRTMYFEDSGDSARISTEGTGPFVIRAASSGGNHLAIDTSGRVTIPNQPYSLWSLLDTTIYTTGAITPKWTSRKSFRGTDGYSSSTGNYTAPVAGVYSFQWVYLYQDLVGTALIDDGFLLNGSNYQSGNRFIASQFSFGDSYTSVKGAVNVYLNANDTFSPRTQNSGDASWRFYGGDQWGFFSATLIS